ncbi:MULTISPECIES: Clp protease N-terminal domain-containing protein [Streptomyces]|uniref:Clp protease N-terminal domain-containing protein n=1 Tax=Streptomyces TaxID=1883 RepID=UPI00163BF09B|nr:MULTISPECIES: Clp protease N-terminal domain-containing protein [Streptomyces]MBC2879088.1 Clp protease [Streptomyces sp. TYQ1024]UBI36059.1 peptidase [Streptomyces mobaraensis]UKW28653.1 peptidase [Streptomyces sp. TYQ1024]
MFERFTKEARFTVIGAQEEARILRHSRIGAEHLLAAVAGRPQSLGGAALFRLGITPDACREAIRSTGDLDEDDAEALRALGIDLSAVRARAERAFGPGALDRAPGGASGTGGTDETASRWWPFRSAKGPRPHVPFAVEAKRALEQSLREALARKENWIGTEHVVLGVLALDHPPVVRVLRTLGTDPQTLRADLLAHLRPAA